MSKIITIKTPENQWQIPEGKPVMIRFKTKNKQRPGVGFALGWIKTGEKPGTVMVIHSTFNTWDKVEQEYPCKWTVYKSSIMDIKQLRSI